MNFVVITGFSSSGGGIGTLQQHVVGRPSKIQGGMAELLPSNPLSNVTDGSGSCSNLQSSRVSCKNSAAQTDPLSSSSDILESLCDLSVSDIEKDTDDPSEPFVTHEQYKDKIRIELAAINWTASLAYGFGGTERPSAPDVEMMTIGHRLSQAETPQLQNIQEKDSALESETNIGMFKEPFKSFAILPSNNVQRPLANRPNSSLVIIDYLNSPPSSEITVPSDNLSDVSTFNSSFISTPNSVKYTALLSARNHSQTSHKSAFNKIMPLTKSSTTSTTNGNSRRSKKLIIPDVKEPKEMIIKKTRDISTAALKPAIM